MSTVCGQHLVDGNGVMVDCCSAYIWLLLCIHFILIQASEKFCVVYVFWRLLFMLSFLCCQGFVDWRLWTLAKDLICMYYRVAWYLTLAVFDFTFTNVHFPILFFFFCFRVGFQHIHGTTIANMVLLRETEIQTGSVFQRPDWRSLLGGMVPNQCLRDPVGTHYWLVSNPTQCYAD